MVSEKSSWNSTYLVTAVKKLDSRYQKNALKKSFNTMISRIINQGTRRTRDFGLCEKEHHWGKVT